MFRFLLAKKLARLAMEKLVAEDPAARVGVLTATHGLLRTAAVPTLLSRSLGVFGAGVVVGAGLGLLLAPKTGAETRASLLERIQGKVREVKRKAAGQPLELTLIPPGPTRPLRPVSGGNGSA